MAARNSFGYFFIDNSQSNNGDAIVCLEMDKGVIDAEVMENHFEEMKTQVKVRYNDRDYISLHYIPKNSLFLGILNEIADPSLVTRIKTERKVNNSAPAHDQEGTEHLDFVESDILVFKCNYKLK